MLLPDTWSTSNADWNILRAASSSYMDSKVILTTPGSTHPPSSRKPQAATEENRLSIGKRVGAAFGRVHKQEPTYNGEATEPGNEVCWPQDLLPQDFPDLRVITYGYDSHVTHGFKGPAMQLDIFSYGESLLYGRRIHLVRFLRTSDLRYVYSMLKLLTSLPLCRASLRAELNHRYFDFRATQTLHTHRCFHNSVQFMHSGQLLNTRDPCYLENTFAWPPCRLICGESPLMSQQIFFSTAPLSSSYHS